MLVVPMSLQYGRNNPGSILEPANYSTQAQ